MKQKEAFAIIRGLGLTVRKQDGEYRVALPANEASAYYTHDLEDAVSTARSMAARANHDKLMATLPCSDTRH